MILNRIVEAKRKRLSFEKTIMPLDDIKRSIKHMETKDFKGAMTKKGKINIIGEVKKASPSKGIMKEDFDFLDIGLSYERFGIDAVSILTEEDFFLGKKKYLEILRKEINIPILRKDFIIDSYQIYESKALGADAILLIAAILDKKELKEFEKVAKSIGLYTIVEVHDLMELKGVLEMDTDIIGINNRNLKTFQVDIRTTRELKDYIPEDKIVISESGISTREDMEYLESMGVNGVLIGEGFMKAESMEDKIKSLRGN